MGDRMNRHTTPKSMVWQGVANTPSNRCHTTTTPYGGRGGGGAAAPVSREVGHIADRLARLTLHHRHPERFHEEKSELVHELRKLARAMA